MLPEVSAPMVRLYNAPCKCCGSSRHGLLTQETVGSDTIVKIRCPVSRTHGGSLEAQFSQGTFSYSASPQEFVSEFGYDPDMIAIALRNFEEHGNGGVIGSEGLEEFKEEVWKTVEDRRASWEFRTTQVIMENDGSDQINDPALVNPGYQQYPIFCDLDGVLADFEEGVRKIFRKEVKTIPNNQLWSTLARQQNFYGELPWMKDGKLLWEGIKHLKPTIITAAPRGSWAGGQKREWVRRHLGEDIRIIISTRKFEHCPPNPPMAILIDDRRSNCEAWEVAGGISIFHESTLETIERLQELGCDVHTEDRTRSLEGVIRQG